MKLSCAAVCLFAAAVAARAQQQDPGPITVDRVREVVSWLAADERQGRDCPSPGLDAAAQYIAEHFARLKLEQAVAGSWFHDYTLPGSRLDSRTIALTVEIGQVDKDADKEGKKDGKPAQKVEFKPDADVRLWRVGEQQSGAAQEATVAGFDDSRVERLLGANGGRRPIVLEIAEDHPVWLAAAGVRQSLRPPLRAAAPVFLARKGLLPAGLDPEAPCTATWSVAGNGAAEVPLRNVAAVLRGSRLPDEYVVVSAHYDHIGIGRPVGGDAINNGADDDATGTTAVMLIAAALAAGERPARSVAFVCFSAEEKGLRGSAAFAEHPPFPLTSIVANVNIEMIGRPEEGKRRQAWITGSELSDFATIAGPALQRAGIEPTTFRMARQLFSGSDNLSFARQGVVAHSISAGSLHADYHQPSDEVELLDLEHMTAVIVGLREVVLEFANREGRPAYNAEGKEMIEQLGRRRGRGR